MCIEHKHYGMVSQWISYFNPKFVIEYGCGPGHFLKAFNDSDVEVLGMDLSSWIVNNCPHKDIQEKIKTGSITTGFNESINANADFVLAFDVLEHLQTENDVKDALKILNNHKNAKHVLISVPVIGNPCLEADYTHMIFKSEKWWTSTFKANMPDFELIKTPDWFYFAHQIYIMRRKTNEHTA